MAKLSQETYDKIIELLQVAEPVTDINGKILYYHGTIKSMENLYELIKNEDVSFSPVLSTFKSNFETIALHQLSIYRHR